MRHGIAEADVIEPALLDLAYAHDVPLVATNDVHFLDAEGYEAHDALICIAEGAQVAQEDRRRLTVEHRFKTAAEMADAVRRRARGGRQHAGDRPALRVHGADARADPADLRGGRGGRDAPAGGRGPGAAPGAGGLDRGHGRGRARGGGAALPRAACLRARRDRPDEVPGLLPDRLRLHQVGQGQRRAGGAGPRLGCGLGGGLEPGHHRSRPVALRAAVRAVPQSRPRLDAGLRHRLLRGPAARGDHLCPRPLRRGPRGADHHLRHAAGARRPARRRPRAGPAVRPGRPDLQARAATTRPTR